MHDTTQIHVHFDSVDGPRRCACGKHADTARTITLRDRPIATAPKSESDLARDLKARLTSGWTQEETTDDVATEAPSTTPPLSEQEQAALVRYRLQTAWNRQEEE